MGPENSSKWGFILEACLVFPSVTNTDSVHRLESVEPRIFCSQTCRIKLSVREHAAAKYLEIEFYTFTFSLILIKKNLEANQPNF